MTFVEGLALALAAGFVLTIFYGITLFPYADELVDAVREDHKKGRLWRRLGPGFLIWVVLAVAEIVEWVLQTS